MGGIATQVLIAQRNSAQMVQGGRRQHSAQRAQEGIVLVDVGVNNSSKDGCANHEEHDAKHQQSFS